MDYLTHVPQDIARAIPDSLDSYSKRADQVTSLLDEILRQQACHRTSRPEKRVVNRLPVPRRRLPAAR